jgi:hypothetical protein
MFITINDETISGTILRELNLEFESQTITVKDLITQRVLEEVAQYNKKLPKFFNGLIEPTNAEKTLNGYKLKKRQTIDAEKQVFVALDAFQKNGYFLLINKIQSMDLEQEIELKEQTKISFIKLTPLVGG